MVVSLTAVLAVKQVSGFLFEYIVQWASLSGALAWMTIALGIASLWRRTSSEDISRACWGRPSALAAGALCTAFALTMGVLVGVAAGRTRPENQPDAPPIAAQVVHWLAGRPSGVVGVRYLTCLQPSLLCTQPAGRAIIGQLVRRGVPTQPQDFDSWYFAPVLPAQRAPVTYPLLVGFRPGESPEPPAPWHQIARSGQVVVYARN
jgi:hypothetical protein